MIAHKGFQTLLYRHLEMSGKYSVKAVAGALGIPTSTLYKYVEGELTFPADLIGPLYRATGEREFIDYLLAETDLTATPRPVAPGESKAIELETLDVSAFAGQLAGEVAKAVADRKISQREAAEIEVTINRLASLIEQLRNSVRRAA